MTIQTLALAAALVFSEAAGPPSGPDPLAQYVFAPDLVMRHASEIGLDEKQRAAVKEAVLRMQTRFLELQWDIQAETEKLARLLQANNVDETAVLAQADRVMALERDVKKTHLALLVRVKNLLSEPQREKLRELRRRAEGAP